MPIRSSDLDIMPASKRAFCLTTSFLRQPSPLDGFLAEEVSKGQFAITRDVNILMNQQRVSKYGLDSAVADIVSRVRYGSLSDKFSHLSDDDLASCVKSRYIQSPSELLDWSAYLESQLSNMEAAAAAEVRQQQEQQVQTVDSSDSGGSSE